MKRYLVHVPKNVSTPNCHKKKRKIKSVKAVPKVQLSFYVNIQKQIKKKELEPVYLASAPV